MAFALASLIHPMVFPSPLKVGRVSGVRFRDDFGSRKGPHPLSG